MKRLSCLEVVKTAGLSPVKLQGDEHKFICPNHDDHDPSLLINAKKNKWMCGPCGSGGSAWALAAFLAGIHPDDKAAVTQWLRDQDLISNKGAAAEYIYRNEAGQPIRKVTRLANKDFPQYRYEGGEWISGVKGVGDLPYRLEKFKDEKTVFIAEGEKDVEALWNWDIPATCNAGGAGKWKPNLNRYLKDRNVVIIPDNDDAGRNHAFQVARQLLPVARGVKIIELESLPKKGDFSDWKANGGTKRRFFEIVKETPMLTAAELDSLGKISKISGISSPKLPEIRPLRRKIPKSDPFPTDALGSLLCPVAQVIADSIQAPVPIIGNSLLAASSFTVQPHANVVIDGREIPLSLFMISIGESGERKSAVDKYVCEPLANRQKALCSKYQQDLDLYQIEIEAYKQSRSESVSGTKKNYQAKKEALLNLDPAPLPPLKPLLLMEEPTYEGLTRLFDEGQPSLGLFSDEGGRLLYGHAMNSDNQVKTAAGLSGLWDGKPISRVRATDGSALLFGKKLALHLMIQPRIAQELLSDPNLMDQGLLSRCLVTWPETTAGSRSYRETNIQETREFQKYFKALTRILESHYPLKEGTKNELDPRPISLSPEAKQAWIAFHDAVERELGPDGKLSQIRGMANKIPEQAARIAGVLTLIEDPEAAKINFTQMESGIRLAQFYLNEAIRLCNASQENAQLRLAESLLKWLHTSGKKTITLVEIYQRGPNSIRDAATARRLMKILESHGWVVTMPEGEQYEGTIRAEAWEIRHE